MVQEVVGEPPSNLSHDEIVDRQQEPNGLDRVSARLLRWRGGQQEFRPMKLLSLGCAALLLATTTAPAFAKGTVKGAAAGAVAGHFVGKGHAKSGAVAGAMIGHHHGNKVKARKGK